MSLKTRRCSFCGTQFECEGWLSAPYSCGEPECERDAVEVERERDEQARCDAQEDNYERYR